VEPIGNAFQVNVYTPDSQLDGDVILRGDGSFVVVWQSFGQDGEYMGVFSRRVSGAQAGPEFQVNEFTPQHQSVPRIATAGDDYMLVWEGWVSLVEPPTRGVVARRLDATGTPTDGEFVVVPFAGDPAIDGASGIGFVVASSYLSAIRARRFEPDLGSIGAQFQVNVITFPTAFHSQPAVALGLDGRFAVVWTRSSDNRAEVHARLFDGTGAPQGGELQINAHTFSSGGARVTHGADGHLQVVWNSYLQDGSDEGVFTRRLDASGSRLATELQLSVRTVGGQSGPRIARLGDDGFVVVWSDDRPLETVAVGRLLDAGGQPIGGEFQIDPASPFRQSVAGISARDDGHFVVIWSSAAEGDPSLNVLARHFRVVDAEGVYEVPTLSLAVLLVLATALAAGGWLLLRR
jgi:hypothetical protein